MRFIQPSTLSICCTLYLSPFLISGVREMAAIAQGFHFFYVNVF
jgi:hypothetical protein